MTTLTCSVCGKQFELPSYRVKLGYGKTCSLECSYKVRCAPLRKQVEKVCERCGKTFTITPSMDAKGKGRFCSKECKCPIYERTCPTCGKTFRHAPQSVQRYCSKECAYSSPTRSERARRNTLEQWQIPAKRMRTLQGIKRRSKSESWRSRMYFKTGKDSPFYRNGNAQLHSRPQQGAEKQWRRDVFRRDDYTCQRCGAKGGKLNAHHIKPWIDHPELRYDVENGITLCVACHLITHGKKTYVPKHYRCIDCGIVKSSGKSPRCQSCAAKHSYDVRGRKPPSVCLDCGKQLSKRKFQYCSPCAAKRRWQSPS